MSMWQTKTVATQFDLETVIIFKSGNRWYSKCEVYNLELGPFLTAREAFSCMEKLVQKTARGLYLEQLANDRRSVLE